MLLHGGVFGDVGEDAGDVDALPHLRFAHLGAVDGRPSRTVPSMRTTKTSTVPPHPGSNPISNVVTVTSVEATTSS
jgi:hypothetical protein